MKKASYLTLLLALVGFLGFGQSYEVYTIGPSGTVLPNVSIFKLSNNGSWTLAQHLGDSDSSGTLSFNDSSSSVIHIAAYDCNGNLYTDSSFVSNPVGIDSVTMYLPCAYQIDCNANIIDSATGGTGTALIDLSYGQVSNFNVSYYWDFGDGNYTQTINNPAAYHTYASAGTYTWQCIRYVEDSVNGIWGFCNDTLTGTVTFGTPPSISCNAAYIVDTANSLLNTAVLWNTSTPTYNDPNFTTTYSWDFGDGNTSNLPFPTHTYTNIGMYQVCLSIYTTDGTDSCVSNYCDSLGMDANGNLMYKGQSTGFVLKVLDPNSISIHENPLDDFAIFPNPANDHITLSSENGSGNSEVKYVISDLSGRQLSLGTVNSNSEVTIDVSHYPSGMYLLHLSGKNTQKTMKIQIAH